MGLPGEKKEPYPRESGVLCRKEENGSQYESGKNGETWNVEVPTWIAVPCSMGGTGKVGVLGRIVVP